MKILVAIGWFVSIGCGLLVAQAQPDATRFTLSGTVVDGLTKRPLAGVDVTLDDEQWNQAADPVTSDAQGRFAFRGLAAGEYILSATGSFGAMRYGEAPDPGWVSTVHIGTKDQDKSLVFAILPRGAMEGVVRDEFGEPMVRMNVSVVRAVWRDGRTMTANVASKFTDDRGRYHIGNLQPGNYVVCTGAGPGGMAAPPLTGAVDFAKRPQDRFYMRTCYPSGSRTLQLSAGQNAQVDLTPTVGSGVTVRGTVQRGSLLKLYSINLVPDGGAESGFQLYTAVVSPPGNFEFRGVCPGRYWLRAQVQYLTPGSAGETRALAADFPVQVGSSDIFGLDVPLEAPGSVTIAVHGVTENHIDPDQVNLMLRRADSNGTTLGASRDKDGTYVAGGLGPGRYWLSVTSRAGTCVESMKVGDTEFRNRPLEVAAGAALKVDLTVSKNCGAIQARAMREGEPVQGAKMVLLLSGTPADPGQLFEDYSNDEGELAFSGLSPGRYLIWSWAVAGKGAMVGPSSLAAVSNQAVAVEVKAGGPVQVDVPVLTSEGKEQ